MLLLRPDPGACVDRQVILRLKIEAAKRKGVDSHHFIEEQRALQQYLDEKWFPSIPPDARARFDHYSEQLLQVNRELWALEDEVRALKALSPEQRKEQIERIVAIAFSVPEVNDERARLVERINALFGVTAKEKLYATTKT